MKKATIGNAVKAKCHECCGYWADGKHDCGITTCPLYSWMPYKAQEPSLEWCSRDPKKVGIVEHVKKSRPVPWLKKPIPEGKN